MLSVVEDNYLALLYVNELISVFLPYEESSPEIFSDYLELLKVAEVEIDESALRRFELKFMRVLGYFPDISQDAKSGAAINGDSYYQFVINHGFVECVALDRDSVDGHSILGWLAGNYQQDSVRRLAKSVLRSTIDYNLNGKSLKSRKVYHEIKQRGKSTA